jgi:hypothetical protein
MRIEERRQFIRLKAYHLVKYKPVSEDKKEASRIIASIKDIGAGGVCFITDEYLPVSCLIEIKINFPHLAEPVFALAKVAWIKQRKKTKRYEVGAQFIEIDESVRNFIDDQVKFVESRVHSKKKANLSKILLFRKESGGKMVKISKALVTGAFLCVVVAVSLKLTKLGSIFPGPQPLNWAKLADTILLFSIAISVGNKK